MESAVSTELLTAEQFERDYVGVPWCELYRGRVIHLSPAAHGHNEASSNAHLLLGMWARATKRGRAFTNEPGVITERGPDTVRGADVAYFSYERMPKGQEPTGFYTIPPEIVVEVVGMGQTKVMLTKKAAEYLKMGVDRVWVIDPRSHSMEIFIKGAKQPLRYEEADEVTDALILPGFSCRVTDFFEN